MSVNELQESKKWQWTDHTLLKKVLTALISMPYNEICFLRVADERAAIEIYGTEQKGGKTWKHSEAHTDDMRATAYRHRERVMLI